MPKHKGITWLIMPMDLPGIEVRPLVTVHGSAEFAELFLDEVRIPVTNRVGDENDGWRVANVTLSFERGTGFVGEMLDTTNMMRDLVDHRPADPEGRRARRGTTPASVATSASSPPSSTPSGPTPSATSRPAPRAACRWVRARRSS